MEFALTRKQLNKKREKEQATATPGQPAPAAVRDLLSAGGRGPAVDPVTGLPAGYDPPRAVSTAPGSEFFTSGTGVLGRQPSPPGPPPSPGLGSVAAPPAAGPPMDTLVPPTSATPTPPVVHDHPGPPAMVPRPSASPTVGLIEGDRPKGADLARMLVRRYAGFVLFILIAILLMVYLPSLRHSTSSPSGLRPVPTVTPASASPVSTGGWTAGPGTVSVTTSYA